MKRVFIVLLICLFFALAIYSQTAGSPLLKLKFTISSSQNDRIRFASFSPDGKKILMVTEGSTQIWSAETGKLILTFPRAIKFIEGFYLKWQPNGTKLLQVGSLSGKKAAAYLWETADGRLIARLDETYGTQTAEWNSRGDKILTAGALAPVIPALKFSAADVTYTVRDENGKPLSTGSFKPSAVSSLRFAAGGDQIIINYRRVYALDNKLKPLGIFEAADPAAVKEYGLNTGKTDPSNYPFISGQSPDGNYFCGQILISKGLACWRTAGGELPVYTFLDDKESGNHIFMSFSPDSKLLAVSRERKKTIELVDTASGKIISTLDNPNAAKTTFYNSGIPSDNDYESGQSWSPSGKFFVAGNFKKEANIWNTETGRRLAVFPVLYAESEDFLVGTIVTDYERFSFNPNEKYLLSVSRAAVRLCSSETGEILWEVIDNSKKDSSRTYQSSIAGWNKGGNLLMTAGEKNQSVLLWDFTEARQITDSN